MLVGEQTVDQWAFLPYLMANCRISVFLGGHISSYSVNVLTLWLIEPYPCYSCFYSSFANLKKQLHNVSS